MSHHHHDNECCHEHHHEHHHEELGNKIIIIIATVILLVAAVIVEKKFNLKTWQLLLVYLVPYLLVGWETLKEASEGLLKGEPFNEHFLMAVATIGALCIGFLPGAEAQFPEAVVVMLFFQIGELFEGYAEGQSRKSIAHLMDIRPDRALVERDGVLVETSPESIAIGETIVVKAGEKIPLDGIVSEGSSSLDTKALTGESVPGEATVGDQVISGCINLSGVLKIRTTKSFKESTVSKILDLVENAQDKKSRSEAFITRFAKVYTPIVVFAAIILAFLPPLVSGNFSQSFPTWLYRALMFLVVSCPCALVISVPLTFFGGIGGASRKGILIKGANCLDILSDVKTVVFDKTGTLTQGKFAVEAIHPDTCEDEHHTRECQQSQLGDSVSDRLIHLASHVEHFSTHPIAGALRDAFPAEATDGCQVTDIEEIAGQGAKAKVGDDIVYVGNSKLMESIGVKWHPCHCTGTIIHIAINGEYAGHIVINDQIKEDSISAISNLKAMGVSQCVMLTGDHMDVAKQIAEKLSLTKYYAELLPSDKVEKMESIIAENKDGKTAFVGDGINDAPVLARADIGIAMGALGSDAAIEAADVVLMDDKPSRIATAIRIARRTLSIAKQNIWFAIAIKVAVLILAALGIATMWMAVFADVGVTVLAVLNAMRALR
ncbi:MAG: heavy metal translocating P-type ATPase [Bacteroidales bacterium]|nr:heavy metal translocating P-type ATPase [Bacteroidales bacterium]